MKSKKSSKPLATKSASSDKIVIKGSAKKPNYLYVRLTAENEMFIKEKCREQVGEEAISRTKFINDLLSEVRKRNLL